MDDGIAKNKSQVSNVLVGRYGQRIVEMLRSFDNKGERWGYSREAYTDYTNSSLHRSSTSSSKDSNPLISVRPPLHRNKRKRNGIDEYQPLSSSLAVSSFIQTTFLEWRDMQRETIIRREAARKKVEIPSNDVKVIADKSETSKVDSSVVEKFERTKSVTEVVIKVEEDSLKIHSQLPPGLPSTSVIPRVQSHLSKVGGGHALQLPLHSTVSKLMSSQIPSSPQPSSPIVTNSSVSNVTISSRSIIDILTASALYARQSSISFRYGKLQDGRETLSIYEKRVEGQVREGERGLGGSTIAGCKWTTSMVERASKELKVSLQVNLFPNFFCLGSQRVPIPYESSTRSFLRCVDRGLIPIELTGMLPCAYYEGCIVVEIRDFRYSPRTVSSTGAAAAVGGSGKDMEDKSDKPNEKTTEKPNDQSSTKVASSTSGANVNPTSVKRVLLRPSSDSMLVDIDVISNDYALKTNKTLTNSLLLELESRFILATAPPLCLEPSADVLKISSHINYNAHLYHQKPSHDDYNITNRANIRRARAGAGVNVSVDKSKRKGKSSTGSNKLSLGKPLTPTSFNTDNFTDEKMSVSSREGKTKEVKERKSKKEKTKPKAKDGSVNVKADDNLRRGKPSDVDDNSEGSSVDMAERNEVEKGVLQQLCRTLPQEYRYQWSANDGLKAIAGVGISELLHRRDVLAEVCSDATRFSLRAKKQKVVQSSAASIIRRSTVNDLPAKRHLCFQNKRTGQLTTYDTFLSDQTGLYEGMTKLLYPDVPILDARPPSVTPPTWGLQPSTTQATTDRPVLKPESMDDRSISGRLSPALRRMTSGTAISSPTSNGFARTLTPFGSSSASPENDNAMTFGSSGAVLSTSTPISNAPPAATHPPMFVEAFRVRIGSPYFAKVYAAQMKRQFLAEGMVCIADTGLPVIDTSSSVGSGFAGGDSVAGQSIRASVGNTPSIASPRSAIPSIPLPPIIKTEPVSEPVSAPILTSPLISLVTWGHPSMSSNNKRPPSSNSVTLTQQEAVIGTALVTPSPTALPNHDGLQRYFSDVIYPFPLSDAVVKDESPSDFALSDAQGGNPSGDDVDTLLF